jgi:hypothetical protein
MMKMKKLLLNTLSFSVLFFFFLFVSGCKEEETPGFVQLNFDHLVKGQELKLNETWYDCTAGHKYQVTRLKYYTSNFILTASDGTTFEVKKVHYRDIENPDTRSFSLGEVPENEYKSLSFIFGLDEATNVDGGLPNTTTNINMEWPLPGDQGYHYMKFEGRYDMLGTGTLKNFNLHTGATGNNQNYVQITIPFHHAMTLDNGTWNIDLVMDMNEWLQNPNVYDFETFGSMIMANQNAQIVLKQNGADVFTIESVEKE